MTQVLDGQGREKGAGQIADRLAQNRKLAITAVVFSGLAAAGSIVSAIASLSCGS